MSTTQQSEVCKNYLYYRSRRAKPGTAKLKAEYLEAFRLADACYEHMSVQCSGNNPPTEWLDKKQAFHDETRTLSHPPRRNYQMMNTAASNPARAWPTGWGKEAVQWAKEKLSYAKSDGDPFKDRLSFMRACVAETNGMIDPKVPSNVWDEANAQS